MNLPLYKDIISNPPELENEGNHGLWFERFFSGYSSEFGKDEVARRDWLEQFNKKTIGKQQHTALIDRALALRLLAQSQQGKAGVFTVEGQLVTGMGLPHPVENGFLWHPTLGMPYLPGSIVKGIVRALVETSYHGVDKDEILLRWFGSKDKFADSDKGDNQTGNLIFLDALPTKECRLFMEIMTPHMGKWYEKGGDSKGDKEALPGDWHSPNPVSYLVARELSLQFIILPRVPSAEKSTKDIDNVWKALTSALDWLGAGAKTAIGFGRMALDEKAEKQLNEKALEKQESQKEKEFLSSLSEIEKQTMNLEQLIKKNPLKISAGDNGNNNVFQAIKKIVEFLIENKATPEEKSKVLAIIIKGEREERFRVSNNRDKEYRSWKATLRE